MNLKNRPAWLAAAVAVLSIGGCASNRQVLRHEVELREKPSQTLDGLTLNAKVFDVVSMRKDPRLTKTVEVIKRTSGGVEKANVWWNLLPAPVFELRVSNQTGHVVRMTGAVFKLIDSAGNLHDAVPKDRILAMYADNVSSLAGMGMTPTPAAEQAVKSGTQQLKILDENTQLLPDMTDTFFVAFQPSSVPAELDAWMAQQTVVRLKIYEVPTKTNEAGAVTKRVAFEFPVTVKTFRDTFEDGLTGSKLIASEELKK